MLKVRCRAFQSFPVEGTIPSGNVLLVLVSEYGIRSNCEADANFLEFIKQNTFPNDMICDIGSLAVPIFSSANIRTLFGKVHCRRFLNSYYVNTWKQIENF